MRKDEIIAWLKVVYDKLLLVVVLGAILVSLLVLIFSAVREKKSLTEDQWLQPPFAAARQKSGEMTAAGDAIETIGAPFQVGGWTTRMVVAELRVNCVKCNRPIPINAEVCPFRNCNAPQPKIISTKTKDSDFDGMPDEWEIRYELGVNIDDAAQDADSDGFSNLEEYLAGTNPRDAASAPPPVTKLRLIKAGRLSLPLVFGGAQQSKNDTLFLVKNKNTKRDSYVRIGDVVEGYKITGYEQKTNKVNKVTFVIDEDASVLKVSKDGKTFSLPLGGKSGAQGEWAASLVYLIDNAKMLVKKDDIISLKNYKYKVVDIIDQNVIVADMQSGAEFTIEQYEEPAK